MTNVICMSTILVFLFCVNTPNLRELAMGIWNSLRKQLAPTEIKNSKIIVSLFMVGTAFVLLIVCSLLSSSNDAEITHNSILKVDISFPFQNTQEQEPKNKANVSVEIHNISQHTEDENGSRNESIRQGDIRKKHQNGVQLIISRNISQTTDAESVVEEVRVRNKDDTQQLNISSSNSPSRPPSKCDIYSGKWVYDDRYPLYPVAKCPYIDPSLNCKQNGRRDSNYTKWRWQPTQCNIPRTSVEFFWAPYLVEQDSIKVGNEVKEILKLDTIENHGGHWKNVDILIFNTGHWWTHGNKVELKDFFMEGEYLHGELEPLEAFKRGLITWYKWIDKNIDPTKTKVLFRGFSPTHFSSNQWNKKKGHKCNFETQPILNEAYVNPYPARMKMVDEVLMQMKFPVSLMNITRLSDFRKDAHPSIYTWRKKQQLTQEQRNDPDTYGDCSHWCLPGLPDIWNELLYAMLLAEGLSSPH